MSDLIITGIIDGPLTGGVPKAVEFFALNDIPDLSLYGFGSANNGGGTNGQEYTFSGSALAGDYIYIATETTEFNNFFGFNPDDTSIASSINGDDAIELFLNGSVVDIFGEINVDGTGQPWEYMDGWAYRVPGTGPDGTTFNLSNWTFSGPNALDNSSNNNSANTPFPLKSYTLNGGYNLVINEVYASHTGTDNTEFIEFFGTPGTSLDGLSLIVVEGDSGISGTIDAKIDFNSTNIIGENGFFLVGNPTGLAANYGVDPNLDISDNFLENSSLTVALVETSSISGTSVTGNEMVLDSVALTDGGAGDTFFFDAPVIGPDGSFFPAGARRVTDGVDTDTVEDWVISDFFLGSANTPTAGSSDNGGGEEPIFTPIYDIQGASQTSPFVNVDFNNLPANTFSITGDTVVTTGIVTAVDSNGFYLQDPSGDGNIATSDALFVFTGSNPNVTIGDELQVEGTVAEFFPGDTDTRNLPTTQISNPTITTLSTGNPLPDAVIIGSGGRVPPTENIDDDAFASFDPTTDGIDFFESLEGMRVTAENAVAIAPTNGFGEIFTVVDNGSNATGISNRGTLNISPDDFNPERIQIDEDTDILPGFNLPQVDVGSQLGDVTGVISYDFGNFQIHPTQSFTASNSTVQAEVSNITPGSDQLTVASYNVLNLDPNDNDGDADIANGRFDTIANQIINNLNTPDIIGLQEVQDNNGSVNDGTVAADQTLQTLIDAIADAGGPTYEFIDNTFITDGASGGQPGGNIRTAFLYNPNRVNLVEGSVQTIGDQDPGSAFDGARLPLVADFEFNGQEVTVISNHFSSKGGSAPIFGIEQPFEDLQEDPTVNGSLDERQAQANAVNDFVANRLNVDPDANIVALGDFNEFEFVSPLEILEENLINLTETLPENERYSFIFQGNSQSLDHILVSESLDDVAEFDIVHVNTEFAETEQLASDHDPLVVGLTLESDVNIIDGTRGRDNLVGTDGDDIITGFQSRDTLTGGNGDDIFRYTGLVDAGDIITDFEVGSDKFDFVGVLESVNFSGSNAIADGYVGFIGRGGNTLLTFDPDGDTGSGRPRSFVLVQGVSSDFLNNSDNFIFG
ncbi:endonuclease/exonuclease/phosphatase family protein [Capilliphycus salinus ALCB114379]|uniref:endonuclease/exonuclease/phosphatase family protein n=1 Tax=Capilliphycus salinus TaxID=2768948 RepID=UPI0039A4B653